MNSPQLVSTIVNPFENPDYYRKIMLQHELVTNNPADYNGKSFMCVFFTRFCGVGCPFCFFKSAPARSEITVADQFNEDGINKFVDFCNKANLGYVLISGGGEPLSQKRAVLRTIAEVNANRIVLVTSGNWAFNKEAGKRYLQEIEAAMQKRKTPCKVTVRVSVSSGHSIKLGTNPACNLIQLFESDYRDHPHLKFQIHGFENDPMFQKTIDQFPGAKVEFIPDRRASDDEQVIKIIPQKVLVTLPSGYSFVSGISKIFGSGLRPNLNEMDQVIDTIKTFERDLEESEDNNSAVVYNANGERGLDWSLNYNGNICLWQNQVNDNQWNIYSDDFDHVLKETFRDPITFSYIEKGCKYRERIVAEVSPRAVLRMKSISLRDFSGTVIFEEEKTRLYYAIRVLQDYYKEGRVITEAFEQLPEELKELISGNMATAQELYHLATWTIVDQYKREAFDNIRWHDLLELIKLGHYDLTSEQIQEALDYYNRHTTLRQYASINDVEHLQGELIERRFTDRLMYMKPSSYNQYANTQAVEVV